MTTNEINLEHYNIISHKIGALDRAVYHLENHWTNYGLPNKEYTIVVSDIHRELDTLKKEKERLSMPQTLLKQDEITIISYEQALEDVQQEIYSLLYVIEAMESLHHYFTILDNYTMFMESLYDELKMLKEEQSNILAEYDRYRSAMEEQKKK